MEIGKEKGEEKDDDDNQRAMDDMTDIVDAAKYFLLAQRLLT